MPKKTLITIVITVIITGISILWLQRPSFDVVKSWKQSELINYDSFGPYFLNVVEDNVDLGHLPFTAPRNFFIYVGKESHAVTHGHVKNYSFEYNNDVDKYLDQCEVQWSSEGVTFQEPSGHSLFFPKNSFTGSGR